MELFQMLGAEVEKIWRGANYDENAFPAIAADALEAADLPSKVSAWEVIEWTLKEENPAEDIENLEQSLAKKTERIRQSVIFEPLLYKSEPQA